MSREENRLQLLGWLSTLADGSVFTNNVRGFHVLQVPLLTRYIGKMMTEFLFSLKQKIKDDAGEVQSTDVTFYDYFVNNRNIDLPCINVGKPKRPTYFPLELCSLVENSRQKPQEMEQQCRRVPPDAMVTSLEVFPSTDDPAT
ncbi:protein argonaute 4-like [Abeliophyllum distichum]|uniref:Protein argonaute 4-like n=1 Tax=Abeliophyllum distichum TaxID=126358 RepID=A0ABD1QWW8_9LAMI